jgi:hypothetical protein
MALESHSEELASDVLFYRTSLSNPLSAIGVYDLCNPKVL